jgi:hypothetical protein
MKTLTYTMAGMILIMLSSCSRDVYNNRAYLSSHDLTGKKLAVLPVEVYYTGIPANLASDARIEEDATSLSTQTQVEQAFLMHTSKHSAKKFQEQVQMINSNLVNDRIKAVVPDLRNAWKMAPDSLGRLAGADLVLKVRLVRTRYMSEGLARGINTGTTIFDAIVNTNSNGLSFTKRIKAYGLNYEISLIDAKTGALISSYINKPEDDKNGNSINKGNEAMVKQAAVYASNN